VSLKADPWLSRILAKPAYHFTGSDFLSPAGRAFVDAKVAVEDTTSLLHLQSRGFAVIDTNIQLLRPDGRIATEATNVRQALPGDDQAVRRVAAKAFMHDRFHRDPAIGHDAASRLKEEWAGNYFS
jgi:hypothetical protein